MMTIICYLCEDIPLNYVKVNNRNYCRKCARKMFNKELEELKLKWVCYN